MKAPLEAPIALAPRQAPRALALVLWTGTVGGAEIMMVSLGAAFRRAGVNAEVVFLTDPGSLGRRLAASGVPYRALGFRRGRDILRHPRRYAAEIARVGTDGALLIECGYMGVALRAGGFRGPIVATEHGALLIPAKSRIEWALRRLFRLGAAWSDDAEVAVSDFMLERMREQPHAKRVRRIPNGIELAAPARSLDPGNTGQPFLVGFAGRLVPGKGADHLIWAFAQVRDRLPAKLLFAGDGPERERLDRLADDAGLAADIEFLGVVDDVGALWSRCDVAVFPSQTLPESFGLAALEAMSSGKPVVATSVGALSELVVDGATGTIVQPGDTAGLAAALVAYGEDPGLRHRHGAAARQRSMERFSIESCARSYIGLFQELGSARNTCSPAEQSSSTW